MFTSKTSKEPILNYFTCTLGQAAQLSPSTFSTANKLIDKQAEAHGEDLACGFITPRNGDQEWGCDLLTYEDLRKASIAAAAELGPVITNGSVTCVAFLCASSSDFLFTWLGLMRAGFSILLIAPQCQPEAISHLCKSCDARFLVYDKTYVNLASSAALNSDLSITPIPWQDRGLDIQNIGRQSNHFEPTFKADETDTAYIHHTSGTSSGLPKPIPQTHRGCVGVLPCLDGADAATFTTTPLYHGGIADCFRAWTSNALIWLFPGNKCPITTKNILSCHKVSTSQAKNRTLVPTVKYFSSVPYVLQMLAEDRRGLKMLQDMNLVGVGGAALPQNIGDDLVSKGVKLVSRFGSAECGFLLSSHRNYDVDKDWQYLRLPSTDKKLLQFERQSDESGGSGLYELVVLPNWPYMAKWNRPDGSYATSDLFEAHPSIPNSWKYHSRNDSQITLLTGKKFDPAPIEDEISSRSPKIREALVFGSGKQVPGALIFAAIPASESCPLIEEELWGIVKEVNSKAPDLPTLERSSKGTLLRSAAEKRFSNEIEQAYERSRHTGNGTDVSDDQDVQSVVREIVNSALEERISDDHADFYRSGVDSAKCTQIRSLLQVKLVLNKENLPWNVVYDCGNIERLSEYILEIRDGKGREPPNDEERMLNLVQQYFVSERLQVAQNDGLHEESDFGSQVVLLTGATGALGTHILETLRYDASVSRLICLVRAPDKECAKLRISESLTKRRKKPLSNKDNKVRCLPAKLERTDLGLSHEVLSNIQSRVTHIIHAAWTVNFSLSLRSFTENLTGLNNLLNLLISCKHPAQLSFCSSTASVLGQDHPHIIAENTSSSPKDADTLGYSQSKWVAEAICSVASKQKNMSGRIKVLRIGQLTGDTENGVWNMSEAWPIMLSTVDIVGCLPQREDKLSWLPLDVAAKAVVEISLSDTSPGLGESCPVFHVVNNSRSTSWSDLLSWIQEISLRKFEIVDTEIWVEKLEEIEDHPAKNLLWFWKRGSRQRQGEKMHEKVRFEVVKAEAASEAMRRVTAVDKALVQKIWHWLEAEISRT